VANQVPCTTPRQPAPTSWADQSPECTRPSCAQLPAALHPIVAPSINSALSNVRPMPTTLLEARLGNNQPLPHSMEKCHRQAPTASKDHGHVGVSIRPRNDDECWTVPAGRQKYANDADGPTANGSTHVDEPLCPQPVAQPDAGVFLMSKGG
jgi:hypothetical protein